MFTRWCTPWTALWKYWWINDDFSPFWYPHHRASLRQTFTPLSQWEDKYRQLILLGKQLPRCRTT
jgi:cysteine desulfuration protein SufE